MAIKVRVKPTLPTNIVDGTAIDVAYSGGVFTVNWDVASLTEKSSITSAERDNLFLAAYDSDNSFYRKIDLDTLLTTISAGLDATLVAIAGLAPTANKAIYWTGADVAALYDISAGGRALANTTAAADKLPYYTSTTEASTADFTSYGRSLVAVASEAAFKALVNLEIGTDVQAYDATLTSIALLGTAADRIAYTTGVDTWAETALTSFARSILDDANEATFKATVNLEIGTDVQAFHARLTDIAGITYAQGDVFYFNGTNIVKLAAGTSGQYLKTLGAGANPAWADVYKLGINVRDLGVTPDDSGGAGTDWSSTLQTAIDAFGTQGGVLFFPRGFYHIGAGLTITKDNVTICGEGPEHSDSALIFGATVLRYSGGNGGAAITVHSSSKSTITFGAVFRDIEIKGDGSNAAGIHFEHDTGNATFAAVCAVSNVSISGFSNGAGIHVEFGVDFRFDRYNGLSNAYGIRIDAGTTYSITGRSRLRGSGIAGLYCKAGSSLIASDTTFESNNGPGAWVEMTGDSKVFSFHDCYFENNNLVAGAGSYPDYQLHIDTHSGSTGVRLTMLELRNLIFESPGQNDDIYIDRTNNSMVANIRGHGSSEVLTYGANCTENFYHNVKSTNGGSVDSAARGIELGAQLARKTDVICPHEALVLKYASATTVTLTADGLVLFDTNGNGNAKRYTSFNVTPNITASGAAGLDTGSEANSTWYFVWAIGKPDGSKSAILSTSSSAPTMPSGYAFKGLVGAVYNDGSGNFVKFLQRGKVVNTDYDLGVNGVLAGGTSTTYANVSLTAAVPTIATAVELQVGRATTSGTSQVIVYVADGGSTNTADLASKRFQSGSVSTTPDRDSGWVVMSTAQQVAYYVSGTNASADLNVVGWQY